MRLVFTKLNPQLPLFMESIGTNWSQEAVNRPNGYPYFHWLQTLHGTGEIVIEHRTYQLQPQQSLLLTPRTPHQYQVLAAHDEHWVTQFLTFGGAHVLDLLPQNLHDYQFFNHDNGRLIQFINHSSQKINDSTDPLSLSTLIYQFLLLLQQAQTPRPTVHDPKSLALVRNYLEQHYRDPVYNDDLARLAGFSLQHLNRQFKQVYHLTPLQYLLDLRLRKAQALLLSQRQLTIEQVATQTGFNTASYFTAQFRKQLGLTPKAFRKMN